MVKEAIKRGEQAMAEEAKVNGAAHQNANNENTRRLNSSGIFIIT